MKNLKEKILKIFRISIFPTATCHVKKRAKIICKVPSSGFIMHTHAYNQEIVLATLL